MKDNSSDTSAPASQDRQIHVPDRRSDTSQQAADVARQQLQHIYEQNPPNQPAAQQQAPHNPYNRTHQENFDWRKYHSAWQQYYQQYYQRYYWQQLHAERQKLAAEAATRAMEQQAPPTGIVTGSDPAGIQEQQSRVQLVKKDLLSKISDRAKKVRRSNHFVPIASAVCVGLIFLFMQFNSVLVAQVKAYVSPGALNNDSIVVNPDTNVKVGPEPRLIIPKINVDVPVDYTVKTVNEGDIQVSLRDGATHYNLPGANAVPGQYGNSVVLGHSGNDIFNQGQYKFVFVLLDRLEVGDVYYMHYEGTRYIYKVTEKKVIAPSEVKALQIGNSKPMSTLITCTPPGTALNRLLVFGEQISPDPSSAAAPEQPTEQKVEATLPPPEPSILERLWGYFF